ncbi:MAG TPA: sugar transferase [Aquihabitans sp.]|nr:sugar transferase [Aquihabitans sp.]
MRRVARFLTFVGPILVVLALSKVHAAWVADPPYDFTGSFRLPWAASYGALLTLATYAVGLPDLARSARQSLASAALAAASAAVGVSVLQLVVGDALLPRFVVFGAALGVVVLHVAVGTLARGGRTRDEGRDRVVLVGSAAEAQRLVDDLAMAPERPAVLVAHVEAADAEAAAGTVHRPLIDRVIAEGASVVVLDRTAQLSEHVITQAAALHEAGIRVRTLVQFYEEWFGKLPVAELERASLFFDIGELHRLRYGRVKRLVDLAGALAGLVPLVLAVPFVLVGNLVGNRGPLLYRQLRVGRGGEPFEILKFRSMVPDGTGAGGTAWTARDDPRITPFGRFLRATHVDELPQLLNILRGDLSLVGPRPEQPHYVVELSQKVPFYGMRHLVRPGLTGWAQVKYGYAGDEGDALEKLQYEFFYLRHQSLRFDLRVMGRTVRSVAGSEGRGR